MCFSKKLIMHFIWFSHGLTNMSLVLCIVIFQFGVYLFGFLGYFFWFLLFLIIFQQKNLLENILACAFTVLIVHCGFMGCVQFSF